MTNNEQTSLISKLRAQQEKLEIDDGWECEPVDDDYFIAKNKNLGFFFFDYRGKITHTHDTDKYLDFCSDDLREWIKLEGKIYQIINLGRIVDYE